MPASELPINTSATATQMAQEIFGDGVTVVSASYSGDNRSSGIYSNGDAVSPGATPADRGVILSTGRAQDFTNSLGQENQNTNTSTNTTGQNNNADFNAAAGARTFDASYMDVDFIPTGTQMTMQFIFSSEEYPEYVNSVYQDFVGVWVNGTQVDLGVGNGDTDPGNINAGQNQNLFLNNTGDTYNTEMDGLTITLTMTMNVNPGVVNSIRIGLADVGDSNYDSNLLIAADSIQTSVVAIADSESMNPNGVKTLDVLANDINNGPGTLTITHINGQAVSTGDSVILSTGQTITLNADGTLEIAADADVEDFNFTYGISNGVNTDTGFVNISQVPCFVAGTLIATRHGGVAVENLSVGDLVLTKDDGPQPIRWVGSRTVRAEEDFAPIRIDAGTFGDHDMLMVSPLHRILVRDSMAEVLFGESEVLIAAKDLVNDRSIRPVSGGRVTYFHIMFDRHQVVWSDGLPTESFLPGPQTHKSFEAAIVREICALFPELDPESGDGYGPAARRTLKGYEAKLLREQSERVA